MASTSYQDFTAGVRGIGNRTNAAGAAVVDYTAEEDRLANLLTEGFVTPAGAWRVAAAGGMSLTVGSGSAKADLYAVAGDQAGQGSYLVRLDDVTVAVTVPAADASQVRVDEVWLVVADAAYDGGTVSLPRIGYRTGTPGGGNPGPDPAWDAAALLARVTVPAAASSIVAGNIADQRVAAQLTVDAATLDGLSQEVFFRAANHTKTTHDALAIDAATLDGIDSTGFALAGHGHTQRHIESHISPGTSSLQNVTWDVAFAAPPVVVATPIADPTSATAYLVAVNSITTTGCVVETHSITDGGGVDPVSIQANVIAMEA